MEAHLNTLAILVELEGPFKLLDMLLEKMSLSLTLKKDEIPMRNNVKSCLRKISRGHFFVAVLLTSSGFAPNTLETSFFWKTNAYMHPSLHCQLYLVMKFLYQLKPKLYTIIYNPFLNKLLVDEIG